MRNVGVSPGETQDVRKLGVSWVRCLLHGRRLFLGRDELLLNVLLDYIV